MQKRLFIASLASKQIKEAANQAIIDNSLKWIPSDKLHLTWKFLAKQDEEVIKPIKNFLKEFEAKYFPLEIELDETKAWSSLDRPRVFVWAGKFTKFKSQDQNIEDLTHNFINDLNNGLRPICHVDSEHKFTPHITLGRFKKNTRIKNKEKFTNYKLPKFSWRIDSLGLFESQLNEDGAEYFLL